MSILVGIAPGNDNLGAASLGALLARTAGQDLVLATVTAGSWEPLPDLDRDLRTHLGEMAESLLAEVAASVPAGVPLRTRVVEARSVRRGLFAAADDEGASRIVLGTARGSADGTIRLGGESAALLQASIRPVAIAPQGFRTDAPAVSRVTVAYNGSDASNELVLGAAAVSAAAGIRTRIAMFAPRPDIVFAGVSAGSGADSEIEVLDHWTTDMRARAKALAASVLAMDPAPTDCAVALGAGTDWPGAVSAIDWDPAEVLLIGSSTLGRLTRLAFGTRAAAIIRCAPVPVMLVPRRAAIDYAGRADA